MSVRSLETPFMIDNYVTGASGFIGKHLMSKLSGETVAIPHDKIYGYRLDDFRRLFFLSTLGNMARHAHLYAQILRANVSDLNHLILEAYGSDFESFIYVSSSSVTLPVQTPYSRTKRAAEEMVLAMPIPGCVVRPYSVTGVGEQREHLIPTLIRSCMEGEAMDFVPDAVHDYVDVDDVVTGLLLFAEKKATGVFELGVGMPVTNQEVRELVESACGRKANIRTVSNLRPYDTQDWYCRDSRSLLIGWQPTKKLEQSISEMVEAYAK